MATEDEISTAEAVRGLAVSIPAPPVDEVSTVDAVGQMAKRRDGELAASLSNATRFNPDKVAKVNALAKSTGLPVPVVEGSEEFVAQQKRVEDLQRLLQTSPILARQMADPEFAKLAHSDAEQLSVVERATNFLGNTMHALGSVVPATNESLWGGAQAAAEFGSKYLTGPLAGTVLPEDPLARMAATFAAYRKDQAAFAKDIRRNEDPAGGDIAQGFYSGVQSLGQNLMMLPASLLTGNPAPMLYGMSALVGGQEYGKARDKGRSIEQSLTYATSQAVIEYATEKIPVSLLLKDLKVGSSFYKTVLHNMATEIPGEQVATALQDLNEWAVLHPEQPISTYIAERPSAALQTLVATIVGVGGQVTAVKGAEKIAEKVAGVNFRDEAAMQQEAALKELLAQAGASKLRENAPEAFAAFVNDAAKDGPVPAVYIDGATFMQSVQDAGVDVLALMPETKAGLQEAIETGGNVRIPLGELAAALPGTGLENTLLQHMKTTPDGPTLAESKDKTFIDQTEKQVATIMAEHDHGSAMQQSTAVVEKELLTQLKTANRFTDDVNSAYAKLAAAFYTTTAQRLGISPQEMYARYPLRVQAENLEADAGKKSLMQRIKDAVGLSEQTSTFNQAAQNIDRVLTAASTPGQVHDKAKLGAVSDWLAQTAAEHGYGIHNYQHSMDTSAVRHMRNEHGDVQSETERGQLPITDDDLRAIPQILAQPDAVIFGLKNRTGLDIIVFQKAQPDGNVLYLEEVRNRRGELAAVTMRKHPATMNAETVISTLDLNAERDGGDKLIIVPVPANTSAIRLDQQQDGTARGNITFGDITNGANISLLKNADLSTFLHESGHFFLEVLTHISGQPAAPGVVIEDMNAVLKWFGLTSYQQWTGMTLEERRPLHEKFARGFEAYLFEGKSPSSEMAGVFARFRAWMVNVYKQLHSLDVTLSDEVRQVFDRLLATNDEILQAEAERGYAPLFKTAEEAGWTPLEFQEYQELGASSTQEAVNELQTRSLRDMQWTTNARAFHIKDLQKQAAEKRKAVRAEVAAEVNAEPIYQAMRFLTHGELGQETLFADGVTLDGKLDLSALREMYGDAPNAIWRYLSTGKHGLASNEGLHPDQVAEMFGFGSGDELVRKLLAAESPREKIEGMTDQRMLERYGDLSDQRSIEKAAEKAIHNLVRAKFVASELGALQKAMRVREDTGRTDAKGRAITIALLPKAARQFAESLIARKKIRDIRPAQYAAAETRAGRAAETALAKSKLVEAVTEKRNQLVNLYATRAANEALTEVERGVSYLKRVVESKSVDGEYREQIAALLERFDLHKITNTEAARRQSLVQWVEDQRAAGFEPVIDPALLNEAQRTPYRELPLEEFRGLVDAVKNIEHLGRLKHKLLAARDQREFKIIVDEAAASIEANAKRSIPVKLERNTWTDKMKSGVAEFFAMHKKFAFMAREMDGHVDDGVLWNLIVRPMNEAGATEAVMREKATIELEKILAPVLKGGKMREKTFIPEINASLSREGRIMVALNSGNEGNLQRLLDGDHWTIAQVTAVVDTLTKNEMDFVQAVWDFIETYRAQIGEQQKRITGVSPEWVEPRAVVTKHGTYKGGYIPAKYDTTRSTRSLSDEAAAGIMDQWRAKRGAAKTRDSFTKGRADKVVDRPLRKDFGVITQHVTEVTHRLAWQEYLMDTQRLLRAAPIDHAIREHYGPEVLKAMRDTIEDVAAGEVGAQNAFESGVNYLRTGATIAGLGWRITTSLLQPLGLTQSMVRIGPKYVGAGLVEWMGNAAKMEGTASKIFAKSDFMRLRAKTMQREISEIRNTISGKTSAIEASYFYLIQKMQLVADIPTWLGQYHKSVEHGADEAKAIAEADQAVLDAQGGGQIKDLAAIQRGGPMLKLFTNFYSFFNTTYNLTAEAYGRAKLTDPLSIGRLAVDMLLLYSVPAALGTLLKAALHSGDDGEDEKKLIRQLIADQLTYYLGTMVGLRELAGGLQTLLGLPGDYQGPASVRLFAEIAKLGKQVGQGEVDEGLLKAAGNVGGILLHVPSGQVSATLDGIVTMAQGKTNNPGALLVGSNKK